MKANENNTKKKKGKLINAKTITADVNNLNVV